MSLGKQVNLSFREEKHTGLQLLCNLIFTAVTEELHTGCVSEGLDASHKVFHMAAYHS